MCTVLQIDGINGTIIANRNERVNETTMVVRSVVTLDNGGEWSYVTPPTVDLNGAPVLCEPPACSLHFHMDSSEYARLGVYSQVSCTWLRTTYAYRPIAKLWPLINACCYGNKNFLDNGIDPSNHQTKFEACQIFCWFYKNLRSKWISHRFALWLVESTNHQYKPMGNLLCSRIFIKSAVDPTNVKFGVMITWVNIMV